MSLRHRAAALGLVLAALATLAPAASATGSSATGSAGCGRQLDAAVDKYVATTDARDARRFNDLLHRDVTGVLPGGTVFAGKAEMAGFIDGFFARTDWTQTFELTRRTVSGCASAYVLFDSVYAEPAAGYSQRLAIGLTWTREHGRWLVLADQNTEVV
ncbi:MAG TPA: nuclear transport factor 2 family protein [Actinophytocola sp.]|nr:nuclear transport factor 2 family protein [Actinophytocola sp.]